MRVAVTGAAGLTGAAVVRGLRDRGDEVVAIVRRASLLTTGGGSALADCLDVDAMARAVRGCDALIHVAGIHLGHAIARIPTLKTVSVVLAVSTAGIYSRHRRSVATYRDNEAAVMAARPDSIIVRPTMIYGSGRDRNVSKVIRFIDRYGFLPVVGGGLARIQPIHFEDLAANIVGLLRFNAPGTFDAGGPEPISQRDAARVIFDATGRTPRFIPVPRWVAFAGARGIDALGGRRWVERVSRMEEERVVDIGPIFALTGVQPRDFASGVRAEVAEMRTHG